MTGTGQGANSGQGWRLQPFASFRIRNYRRLWAANVSYGLVQSSQRFVLVWLAIETLEATSSFVASTALMVLLPALLITLPAGALADRLDRKRLLVASHLLMALVLVAAAILSGTQAASQGLVLALALLVGVGVALGEPVRAALVPAIVPGSRLLNANALYPLAHAAGQILGPALAGVAIALGGVETAFVMLAVVIAGGVLFLITIQVPPRERPTSAGAGNTPPRRLTPAGMRADIADGFRFILTGPREVRLLFALLVTVSLLGPWLALGFGDLASRFDVEAGEVAWFFVTLGLGSIVTGVTLASIPRLPNAGGWYAAMLIGGAVLTALVWFASSYGLAVLLMFVYGLAVGGGSILFRTLVQLQTPASLMGRVMGIQFLLLALGALLGTVLSAAGSTLLRSDGLVLLAVVVLVAVTALVLVRGPSLRRMSTLPAATTERAESGAE